MIRRPPRSTRTYTLFPYTTLFRSKLDKCEAALKQLKNNKNNGVSKEKIESLIMIQESLSKKLKTLVEAEGVVTTDDEGKAEKLAKKGIDVKLTNESLDHNQTVKLAAEVGKALARALISGGDELARMKAKRIQANSFDIETVFKGEEKVREYSFNVYQDTLFLDDLGQAKELVNIGTTPGGDIVVHADPLKDALATAIKELDESPMTMAYTKIVKPKEKANEGEGDDHHYIKVPRMEYKAAMTVLNKLAEESRVKMDIVDSDGMGNVIIYFMFKEDDIISGEANSFMNDAVMDLQAYGINVYDHSAEMDEVKEMMVTNQETGEDITKHVIALLKGDIDKKQFVKLTGLTKEAELSKSEKKKLKDMSKSLKKSSKGHAGQAKYIDKLVKERVAALDDFISLIQDKAEDSGFPIEEEAMEVIEAIADHFGIKIQIGGIVGEGTELYDDNGLQFKRFAGPDGIALQVTTRKLKGGGFDYIQIDGSRVKEFARAAVHVAQEFYDLERQLPVSEKIEDKELPKGKHSVGKLQKVHGMIVDKMKELAKLYKEKGGDHKYQGGSEPGEHSVIDHLKSLTKKKKQVEDALEKAVAGTNPGQQLTEVTEEEVDDAVMELRNIVDDIEQKAEEAREVVRQVFPSELSRLDGYGVFNMTYSNNRYDTTLGKFVDRLEENGYEIEDGRAYSNEGKAKSPEQQAAIAIAKKEKNA